MAVRCEVCRRAGDGGYQSHVIQYRTGSGVSKSFRCASHALFEREKQGMGLGGKPSQRNACGAAGIALRKIAGM